MRHGTDLESTEGPSLRNRVLKTYRRSVRFFSREIWAQRLDELPQKRARLYQLARILDVTVRGLVFGDTLHVRAAALTYFTVLSIVPLLAFVFALLKGFGAYDVLVRDSLRPYILDLLAGNEALRTAFEQILGFVEQTGVTSLGFLGLLTLLYAATRLLRNIEAALNEIWDLSVGRTLLQQFRDYVAIIVVTPLCLMAAAALTTASQALEPLRAAGETIGLHRVLAPLLGILSPLAVLFAGLLFLYKVMPYTNVRLLSAALGAAVGGLLWYLVLIAHVRFQIGVARYNALYSSFGAVPIFLAWLHISWLVVLVGAQVAATHQNHRSVAQRTRSADFDQSEREIVCIAAVLCIARAFLACEPSPDVRALSSTLSAPEPLLRSLLERLASAALLVRTARDDELSFTLARPAERIHVKDLLDAVRMAAPTPRERLAQTPHTHAALALWRKLDQAMGQSAENRSLRELIEQDRERGEHTLA
jgi:membrane protein